MTYNEKSGEFSDPSRTIEELLARGFGSLSLSCGLRSARDAAFYAGRRFFALPSDQKAEMVWSGQGTWCGYQPLPNGAADVVDLVERFETPVGSAGQRHFGVEPARALDRALHDLLTCTLPHIEHLLDGVASRRGHAAGSTRSLWLEGHASTAVVNHYVFSVPFPIAMKSHQDFGGLTIILFEDGAAGALEFETSDGWVGIDPHAPACVVVGQLLAGWLGCPAPMHRVRRSEGARQSLVVFHQPALDHTIAFSDGSEVHVGKHIYARQAEYNALDSRYARC